MSEGKRKRNIKNLIIIIIGIFIVSLCVAAYFAIIYKIGPSKEFDDEPITADHMNKSDAHRETRENRKVIIAYDDYGGYGFRVKLGHISGLLPNSTAAIAGLEIGDEVISINEEYVHDMGDKDLYSHCGYFKALWSTISGFSMMECYIDNGWASGNATVKLVVRRNLVVYKQLVRANESGVARGAGSFGMAIALPLLPYAFFLIARALCFFHSVPRERRRLNFFHISLWPLKIIYSSHPILEKEFCDNIERVLDENDVWEEDEGEDDEEAVEAPEELGGPEIAGSLLQPY